MAVHHGRRSTPTRQCMSPMVRCAATLWCATLWAACATPLPPAGGPPDDTPPHIVESIPAAGATNVSEASLRIVFSEHINEASFPTGPVHHPGTGNTSGTGLERPPRRYPACRTIARQHHLRLHARYRFAGLARHRACRPHYPCFLDGADPECRCPDRTGRAQP